MAELHIYAKYQLSKATKLIDLTADDIAVMLLSAYDTSGTQQTASQFVDDVLADATESAGGGYTPGGVLLGSVAYVQDDLAFNLTADDTAIGTGTDAAFLLIFDKTPGSDATNPVIAFVDLGGTITVDTIKWNVEGILQDLSDAA